MSKHNLIGLLLIGAILLGFTYFNRPKPKAEDTLASTSTLAEPIATEDSDALNQVASGSQLADSIVYRDAFSAFQSTASAEVVTLENDFLRLRLSSLGAMPQELLFKQYERLQEGDEGEPLYLFQQDASAQNFILRSTRGNLDTRYLHFKVVAQSQNEVVFRLPMGDDAHLDFTYRLQPDDYYVHLAIAGHNLDRVFPNNMRFLDMQFEQNLSQLERSWENENGYTNLYYKYLSGEVNHLSERKQSQTKERLPQPLQWFAFKNKFFATVVVADADNPFESSSLSHSTYPKGHQFLKKMTASGAVAFDNREGTSVALTYFYVPLAYKQLKGYNQLVADDDDPLNMQRLVNVGGSILRWINIVLITPIVEWLKTWMSNWGLIILVLTLIIKIVLSPLTFKSYMSQAKMRVLKPQVDAINAKYPDQDQASQLKRTQETMQLYRNAGASPMAGCMPMLLQMPFLIALFRYFPTSIDLRGSSFLWAKDLSSYDPILSWDFNIPFLGDHISGFCLLWAIANIVYSRYTMSQASTGQGGQMKMMQWMPIIMSVMFFFFFNNHSSGLSYYYFISIVITMVQFGVSRALINEEKVLARLEANKKKPKKPSGFMARLAEAQKQQERYLREQQKRKR